MKHNSVTENPQFHYKKKLYYAITCMLKQKHNDDKSFLLRWTVVAHSVCVCRCVELLFVREYVRPGIFKCGQDSLHDHFFADVISHCINAHFSPRKPIDSASCLVSSGPSPAVGPF